MRVTTTTATAVFEETVHGPLENMPGSLRRRILSGPLILRAPATPARVLAPSARSREPATIMGKQKTAAATRPIDHGRPRNPSSFIIDLGSLLQG
jgi:hypothetical protein